MTGTLGFYKGSNGGLREFPVVLVSLTSLNRVRKSWWKVERWESGWMLRNTGSNLFLKGPDIVAKFGRVQAFHVEGWEPSQANHVKKSILVTP